MGASCCARGTCILIAAVFLVVPRLAEAVQYKPFEISGWIPYWRAATGTADVLTHLGTLTEVNPFVYTLKSDGTFLDNGKLETEPWTTLRAEAKKKNIRFIPTAMTSNGDLLHSLLSDTKKRIALEDYIAALVKEKGFDGIDLNFEGKKAATKGYFSTFLKGLAMRMKDKWIMCTIEARTPVPDRYFGLTPPKDATVYANDFRAIGQYCDRVRIMAYDQQGVDLKLAAAHASSSEPYAPIADPAWVEKAIKLALKDISKKKLIIGIPTYGYEYEVTAYAGEYVYKPMWTFNPAYATGTAARYNVEPSRMSWGEMAFTYSPAPTSTLPAAAAKIKGLAVAEAARDFAQARNSNLAFRMMVWPDAESVRQKIALAKRLGVRGVSVFKLDGGQDPDIWSVLR